MVAQPTFVYPYTDAIDIEAPMGNTFRCQINSDKLVAYKVDILSLQNTLLYSTGKVADDPQLPIYRNKGDGSFLFVKIPSDTSLVNGVDYKWILTQWEDMNTLYPNPSVWVSYGKVYQSSTKVSTTTTVYVRPHLNVSAGMYLTINGETKLIDGYALDSSDVPQYAQIILSDPLTSAPTQGTDYKINKDWLDNSEQGYPFSTRSVPSVAIDSFGTIAGGKIIIPSSEQKITATYSQSQGIPLKFYKIELLDNNGATVDSTGEVYCADISYIYQGYISGQEYLLSVYVENQSGMSASQTVSFKADYNAIPVAISPVTIVDYDDCSVLIDYSQSISILGKSNGAENSGYKFVPEGVQVSKGTYVYWDEINGVGSLPLPVDFSVILKAKLDEGLERTPIVVENSELQKTYIISYDGMNFYYQINNGEKVPFFPYDAVSTSQQDSLELDTLYVWNDSEGWDDESFWVDNDIATNHYWYIICQSNVVKFKKGELDI